MVVLLILKNTSHLKILLVHLLLMHLVLLMHQLIQKDLFYQYLDRKLSYLHLVKIYQKCLVIVI